MMQAICTFVASMLVLSSGFGTAAEPSAPLPPKDGEAVILLLLDNSASLPPLDPTMQRRDAIEKIYSFLQGQPYRLVLFGGGGEIHIDSPQHYRNSGQWTDFFYAFESAERLIGDYPEGTEFKIILITDGAIDPSPSDWSESGSSPEALGALVGDRTVSFLEKLDVPLYVILIGEELDRALINRMVMAANGRIAASDYAQSVAEFFDDDGVLLRQFIFQINGDEGLETIAPIVRRIAMPTTPKIEFSLAASLLLAIVVLIGVGVRSLPGSGDREILEFRVAEPLQIAVDRLRRLSSDRPAWSWKGLSLVDSSRIANATLTAQRDSTALQPTGFSLSGLDEMASKLIELSLPELQERLEELVASGTKDQQIYALNLEYVARDLEEARVERLMTSSSTERAKFAAIDFLRAKVHLLHNDNLRAKLTGPSISSTTYGTQANRVELRPGSKVQLGRYQFRVDELTQGGRRDFRLGLTYEGVPSALFLKRMVPGIVQRALRCRRSHERLVR